MNSDRDTLFIVNACDGAGLGACAIESNHECGHENCEVRQGITKYNEVTAGQIQIGVTTAIAGIVVSSLFALGILAVWIFSVLHGQPMPEIPMIVSSIAAAPFTAGVITTLRIPRKAKVQISLEPRR